MWVFTTKGLPTPKKTPPAASRLYNLGLTIGFQRLVRATSHQRASASPRLSEYCLKVLLIHRLHLFLPQWTRATQPSKGNPFETWLILVWIGGLVIGGGFPFTLWPPNR